MRFSPTAWAKLRFLCDLGPTEIGGFGISHPDDLLLIDDIVLVRQRATAVHVAFDDHAVADFFDDQVALGRRPEAFGRVWIHTHPGACPRPSPTDEETFQRVFGGCDWAVMFILARSGDVYARLQWHVGPGGAIELPVAVDDSVPFPGSDHTAWRAEYDRSVIPHAWEEAPLTEGSGRAAAWLGEDFSFCPSHLEQETVFDGF